MRGDVASTTTWLDLRDAAHAATRRGWPVTPGTYLGVDRWHGRDTTHAWATWTHAPYGVLRVCGRVMTVLDLPVTLVGLLPLTEALFPVVVTAQSRLLAITKADPQTTLSPRLAEVGVRLSGASGAPAWVALPPAAWVQQVLLTALRNTTTPR